MRDDKTLFLFIFRDEYLTIERPSTEQECKSVLTNVFADVGWECPRILAAMEDAGGIYFDRVSQIRMDRWTKGRTALIGDAAACVSLLAGEGQGLRWLRLMCWRANFVIAGVITSRPSLAMRSA